MHYTVVVVIVATRPARLTPPTPLQAPDLYLGYGASKDAPALYSFEYPVHWEESAVTKTDKSTMVRRCIVCCGGSKGVLWWE